MKRLILKLANKILTQNGGRAEVNGVYLVRMSKGLYEEVYERRR